MTVKNLKKITIVIVGYNSSSIIFNLLKNLINFEIIIVDNGGNNHIIEKIKSYKNIKIISKGKNIGFGNISAGLNKIKEAAVRAEINNEIEKKFKIGRNEIIKISDFGRSHKVQ